MREEAVGRHARWNVEKATDTELVIRDIGPWNQCYTVTNDAETVVHRLINEGTLKPGQRLLYFDSDGELDELLVKDGKFAGFAPWKR